jgi:hypothetical protein
MDISFSLWGRMDISYPRIGYILPYVCFVPPPPHFALPRPSPFLNTAFLRPRDGAAASLCAAADYDPACERKNDNDDDNDYAWGGRGIVAIIRGQTIEATAPSVGGTS